MRYGLLGRATPMLSELSNAECLPGSRGFTPSNCHALGDVVCLGSNVHALGSSAWEQHREEPQPLSAPSLRLGRFTRRDRRWIGQGRGALPICSCRRVPPALLQNHARRREMGNAVRAVRSGSIEIGLYPGAAYRPSDRRSAGGREILSVVDEFDSCSIPVL